MRVCKITGPGPRVESVVLDLIAAVEVRYVHGDYQVWAYPTMGEAFRVRAGFGGESVFGGLDENGLGANDRAQARAEEWAHALSAKIAGYVIPENWDAETL